MRTAHQLRQDKNKLITEARQLCDSVGEDQTLSDEQQARFDELLANADKLEADARRAEAFESRMTAIEEESSQLDERVSSPPMPHTDAGNTRNGQHRFSVSKAIREAAFGRLSGLEAEVASELSRRSGTNIAANAFILPGDLQLRRETRAMTTVNSPGATPTVTSTTLVDFLRNNLLVERLGATVLSDLTGKFAIPKQTAKATAGWKAEGAQGDESDPRIGSIAFSPSRVTTHTTFNLELLNQASIDVEDMITRDLAFAVAEQIDLAAINGSGTAPEPEGILQNSNVATVPLGTDGAAPTWAAIVDLEGQVNTGNALRGAVHYMTSATGASALKRTEKASNTAQFLLDPVRVEMGSVGEMNGYPTWTSEQVPSNLTKGSGTGLTAVIFGDWSSVHIALFGGSIVTVNPYSLDREGQIRTTIAQLADVKLRHDESFAKIVDLDPSA